MRNWKSLAAGITVAATMAAMGGQAMAAPVATAPGQNKLQCFDGTTETAGTYGGTCTLKGNGAKGPAILNNSSTNPNGDYSGVYVQNSTLYGQFSQVTQLSYNYTGTVAPMPGDLSLNVPIDQDGNGTTDGYAYIDAYYCPGTNGTVDIIHDATCGIWYNGVEYANWSAFVAAYPDAKIATDNLAFIVAERTPAEPSATWTITGVTFGSVK